MVRWAVAKLVYFHAILQPSRGGRAIGEGSGSGVLWMYKNARATIESAGTGQSGRRFQSKIGV